MLVLGMRLGRRSPLRRLGRRRQRPGCDVLTPGHRFAGTRCIEVESHVLDLLSDGPHLLHEFALVPSAACASQVIRGQATVLGNLFPCILPEGGPWESSASEIRKRFLEVP